MVYTFRMETNTPKEPNPLVGLALIVGGWVFGVLAFKMGLPWYVCLIIFASGQLISGIFFFPPKQPEPEEPRCGLSKTFIAAVLLWVGFH